MNEQLARRLVKERAGQLCEICDSARGESWHHRKNRSQGGLWTPSNGLWVCGDGVRGCHGFVTENPRQAHDEGGWVVWSHEEPAEVPVLMRRYRSWMLLDDEGMLRFTSPPDLAAA